MCVCVWVEKLAPECRYWQPKSIIDSFLNREEIIFQDSFTSYTTKSKELKLTRNANSNNETEFRKQISRSEIVGPTKSTTVFVEAFIRSNTFNRTDAINYNAYATKCGVEFEKVARKFIDNFLLRTLVPNYNTKDGKNIFLGS